MAKKKKLNWVQKLSKKVKAYFAAQKKRDRVTKTTKRTRDIESQLRRAGLTDKEIAKMRSKKHSSHNSSHKGGGY